MDDAAARSIVSKFGEMRSDLAAASGRLADLAAEESDHGLVAKALEPMEAGRRCWRLVRRERDGTSASARESAGSQPPPPFCSSPPQNALSSSPPSKIGDVLVERTVGEVLPAVQSNQAQIGEVIARGESGAGRGERGCVRVERGSGNTVFFFSSLSFLFAPRRAPGPSAGPGGTGQTGRRTRRP